jgi:hypothetical protein
MASEKRSSIYAHIDFLGKGATSLMEDVRTCLVRQILADMLVGQVLHTRERRASGPQLLFLIGRMA